MKKFLISVTSAFCACILLGFLALNAAPAKAAEAKADPRYFRSLLSAEDQKVYDTIYDCVAAMEEKTDPLKVSSKEQGIAVYDAVFRDSPELFWLDACKLYTVEKQGYVEIAFAPVYRYDKAEVQTAKKLIDREVGPILKALEGLSDYDKTLTLYRYLINEWTFDEAYIGTSFYEAFRDKKAVCEGYSRAFQYIANLSGMEALYVSGTAAPDPGDYGSHSWNIVKVDGLWYQLDISWGDPTTADGSSSIGYDYCLVSDEIMDKNHRPDREDFPACVSMKDNYFAREGLYVTAYSHNWLKLLLRGAIEDLDIITFRCADEEVYQTYLQELFTNKRHMELIRQYDKQGRIRSVRSSRSDQCLTITLDFRQD